ncbi:MAG: hypothetical protein KF699_04355 [Phycisphaeraceae bacterium]|nr:hypothetical protein [Phycisphaeraceae bacterium]
MAQNFLVALTIAIVQIAMAQQTYHVPSEDTQALASALGAAHCGDTVTIEGGLFNVCGLGLQIRQGVHVIGRQGGEGATVLSGQGACRILAWVPEAQCEGGVTTVSNVVFAHGRLDHTDPLGGVGAAVLIDGSAATVLPKVRFQGCDFSNNQSFASGGAVWAMSVDLEVVNCTFNSNSTDNRFEGEPTSATSAGGAIAVGVGDSLAYTARLSVLESTFQNNRALFGGAVYLSACVESATVYAEFDACTFTANDARAPASNENFVWGVGGAVSTVCNAIVRVSDCSFTGNRAGYGGGAIDKHDLSGMQIKKSYFGANETFSGVGGAIAWGVGGGGDAVVNCSFAGNRAMGQYPGGSGGALGFFNGVQTEGPYVVQVINCLLAQNVAGSDGVGGFEIARGDGGAVSVVGGVHVFVSQCTIANNFVYPSDTEVPGRAPAIFASAVGNLWPEVNITNTILFGSSNLLSAHVCFVDPATGDCVTNNVFEINSSCIGGVVNEVVVGCDPAFAGGNSFHLTAVSDCIDVGSNALVSFDVLDVDDDLDQMERHPIDLGGRQRVLPRRLVRDPVATEPPCLIGVVNVIDIGAFEFPTAPFCWADWDGNGVVEVADIFAYLADFFASHPCADLDLSHGVDPGDIFVFLGYWFAGC